MSYIKNILENRICPWMSIIEKEIRFPHLTSDETYYSIKVPDYAAALVVTSTQEILLVKQYRPAVDQFTIELPSGLVEPDETAGNAIIREVYEETGYSTQTDHITFLGKLIPDTGRLENTLWGFYIESANKSILNWQEERGVEPILASKSDFLEMVKTGVFNHALHLAILGLALSKGYFSI